MKAIGRGFSLVELMLALAIVSSLVITGVLSLRGIHIKKQSKAAAEILAEGLRLANLKARAQGYPVGVGIPSALGSTPLARGYYFAAGEFAPTHTVGYDFGTEMPDSMIFSGRYPGPTWTPPLATLSRGNQFDFDNWQPPYPDDTYVIFLPTGEVISNHSAANGGYRLVVCTRATYDEPASGDDPGPSKEAVLTGVSDPYTVTISTQGQVEVVPGLLNGDGSLVKPYRSLPRSEKVALTPAIERLSNRPPVLVDPKLIIEPSPDRKTIPVVVPVGNPAVIVRQDDRVSLTFYARDPDGDQLAARWDSKCISKAALGGGTWTIPSTRMRWDYTKKAWYRTGIWTPPAGAVPNDRFRLYCHITDGRDGELVPSASTAIGYPGATLDGVDVTIIPTMRLAYKDSGGGLAAANFDGSGAIPIMNSAALKAGTPSNMSWSPSRHGLLYRQGSLPYFLDQLDGSPPGVVGAGTLFGGTLGGLAIQGDRLYGVVNVGGAQKIQWMPAPPVGGTQICQDLLTITGTGSLNGLISSASQKALISPDGAGKYALIWLKPATPVSAVVSGPAWHSIVLSPDDTLLYGVASDGSIQCCPISLDGDTQTVLIHSGASQVLVPGPGNGLPSLSPNGSFLVYQDSTGEAQLLNLSKSENAPLNIRDYSDMIWSQE